MIPRTFEDWRYCITEKCKIELTPDFARKRLETLKDASQQEAKVFIQHYGIIHWRNVVRWYSRVVKNG